MAGAADDFHGGVAEAMCGALNRLHARPLEDDGRDVRAVIPGRAELIVDVRHPELETLDALLLTGGVYGHSVALRSPPALHGATGPPRPWRSRRSATV